MQRHSSSRRLQQGEGHILTNLLGRGILGGCLAWDLLIGVHRGELVPHRGGQQDSRADEWIHIGASTTELRRTDNSKVNDRKPNDSFRTPFPGTWDRNDWSSDQYTVFFQYMINGVVCPSACWHRLELVR